MKRPFPKPWKDHLDRTPMNELWCQKREGRHHHPGPSLLRAFRYGIRRISSCWWIPVSWRGTSAPESHGCPWKKTSGGVCTNYLTAFLCLYLSLITKATNQPRIFSLECLSPTIWAKEDLPLFAGFPVLLMQQMPTYWPGWRGPTRQGAQGGSRGHSYAILGIVVAGWIY